jgi:hypothetical protein
MNPVVHPGYEAIQNLLAPLVRWCVAVGIGHGQLSRLSKPLFYEAARQELLRKGLKRTDSALSLASGLHKGDIDRFNRVDDDAHLNGAAPGLDRINPASQVIAHWIAANLGPSLPLRGPEGSFDALVKATQQEGAPLLSTRLILKELERRHLVEVDEHHQVHLISEVGLPAIDQEEAIKHFVGAVRDHLLASLHNLEATTEQARFLEQSLNVDGLSEASVARLHEAARQWWGKALQNLAQQAIALSNIDEPQGGNQRLRIGVYVYSQGMNPTPSSLSKPEIHQ